MRKIGILFIIAAIITSQLAAQQQISSGVSLKTAVDTASYALGMNIGMGMREQFSTFPGGKVNFDVLAAAYVHALKGENDMLIMDMEFAQNFLQSYVMDATVREAEAAKAEEMQFFTENKNRDGIVTTKSGLQYKIVTQGEGEKPTVEGQVVMHYIGVLLDGTPFQSSYDRGEPLTIGAGQMISGLTEGLLLMPVGSKYVFWIPSELAYGTEGAPPKIKPNTALIFEVELLGIEK
jgi:FKBP-type peptidyl-prolyl cis-trans isomerase FkpA/FKBP-type peptidyl-prolyl cis-trans isomerase FklB